MMGPLRRLVIMPMIGAIRVYQWVISPFFPLACRFHPSCSHYAVDALRTHGPIKGGLMTAWRLVRCNPWSTGGLDPVPGMRPDQGSAHPATSHHATAHHDRKADASLPATGCACAHGHPLSGPK